MRVKSLISFALYFTFGMVSNAQLKVHSDGKVSIATTTSSGYALTVEGYEAIKLTYGTSYMRLNTANSNGVIGCSSDQLHFWDDGDYSHVWFVNFTKTSDSTLKTNIQPVKNGLDVVMDLRPKSYSFISDLEANDSRLRYGFLAQDVQMILPDIVDTGLGGVLGIRTDDLIPFLVTGIQEQQVLIDSLQQRVEELERSVYEGGINPKLAGITTPDGQFIELRQNNPNPFKESTTISYVIPETSTSAQIIIYDMRGIELKAYDLDSFGEGELVIEGSTFKAGMYMYALIVDGNYIDSKRMILSK